MKRIINIIFALTISFTLINNLNAECKDSELNDWAEKVNVEYKELKDKEFAYALLVHPYNKNVKVIASSNNTDEILIEYDNEFSSYAIGSYIHDYNKKYIIKIYGNEESKCNGELLRTIKYEVPPFNKYSLYEYCENNKNEEICKINSDTSNISEEEFEQKVIKNEIKDKSFFEKVKIFISKYILYIIIPLLLVLLVYIYKVLKIKKKEKKL